MYERPGEDLRGQAREDAIIEAARALNDLDIDLLKLEYPGSPEGCRRLAAILDRPWAVLSAGVPFDQFTDIIRIAADEGGASGFIAGRSVWREVVSLAGHQREEFLTSVALPRLERLVDVASTPGPPVDRGKPACGGGPPRPARLAVVRAAGVALDRRRCLHQRPDPACVGRVQRAGREAASKCCTCLSWGSRPSPTTGPAGPDALVARGCPGRLPGRPRRVAPAAAAHRRAVLAGFDRRAGADQPAPRAAPPASGSGRRAFARRDVQGSVLARHRDVPRRRAHLRRRARGCPGGRGGR